MIRIRLKRILTIVFLLFVKNIILITIIAYSPPIQSFLAKQATIFLSKKFELDLGIEKLYLKIPNKIVLNNIYLNDSTGNRILETEEINVTISAIKIFKSQLFIDEVNLIEPNINLYVDTSGIANYSYVLNKFISNEEKDTTPSSFGLDIFCNKFSIKDANFRYIDHREKNETKNEYSEPFNISDINVNGINLSVNDIKYYSDTVELSISDFNLSEHSGINLEQLSFHLKYYNTGIILNDFLFKTKYSLIKSSIIELKGKDPDYLSNPISKLTAKVDLDTVIFDISDLSPFIPEYRGIHEKVYISGNFSGKLSNIKIKDFNVVYGNDTKLFADFSIDGLPDYELAFIFGNISTLKTSSKDISKILRFASPKKKIELPKVVDELEYVTFTGNITGLLNDLVAYGEFNTGLGSLRTDLALATDFDKKNMKANGKILANNIELGRIIGDTATFGTVSLNTSLNGQVDSLGNFNANVNCEVNHLGLMGYNYSGINIVGAISNNIFDGELYVDDPNLRIEFLGKYNHDNKNQNSELSFSTDIWANLSNLNLLSDSLNSEISFVLTSELNGDFKDIPQGNVNLSQLKFNLKDEIIRLNQLSLSSYIDAMKQQYLTLRSDYCDVNFYGDFKFKELVNIVSGMAHNYLPAFIDKTEEIDILASNFVNFDIRLKNINTFTKIFIPQINVENEIFIEGMISGKKPLINAALSIPIISYDSIYVRGSELHMDGYKDSLEIKFYTQEISSRSFPIFENLNLNFNVANDIVKLNMNWDDNDSINNSGNIAIETGFIKNEEFPIPKIETYIRNSQFIINNRIWNIAESNIIVNPNDLNIAINNFSLSHESQSISLAGEISNDKSKLLRFAINNIDISNINPYISSSGYQISGILNGNGRVADIYNTPSFRGSVNINNLMINNEDFDRFDLSAVWDGANNGFNIEGNNRYLKLKGQYTPENENIYVNLLVDNFKLEILEPYLNEYDLSNLKGVFDINIEVSGKASNPDIAGYIDFKKAELTYDFLKLRALLDDRVHITKNAILFKNFKISDEYKNNGTINGGLYHNNFKDIRFDFLVNANKMKLLNTTQKDNSSYYGTAYATAEARIAGNLDNLGIDVIAKTEPNTVFVLPMNSVYEGSNVSYLTFINNSNDSEKNTIIQPIKSELNLYFKMDIEVTPEAEVQIAFDPKVGDMLKGNAKGNLKMEYTSDEEFYMYGDVEIVEGDYLFTLQNIINKKLIIKPGGTINWTGDPVNADLNLQAVYNTRAPLKELMMDVDTSSGEYNQNSSIDCIMHMTGKLTSPDIQFSIEVPNGNDKVKAQLANMSQDEINKQFIFLLVMNRFYATSQAQGMNDMGSTTNPIGTTSLELITNQVNNWLSQISKDFDIGFSYHPGTELKGQEFEMALSTQILNDKVLINGNFGYGENNPNNSGMMGDIEVQVKVNQSGSFRVKGFSRTNNELESEYGTYTSGVGVFYTKDFNKFSELLTDIWEKIIFKNARERRKAKKAKEAYE